MLRTLPLRVERSLAVVSILLTSIAEMENVWLAEVDIGVARKVETDYKSVVVAGILLTRKLVKLLPQLRST